MKDCSKIKREGMERVNGKRFLSGPIDILATCSEHKEKGHVQVLLTKYRECFPAEEKALLKFTITFLEFGRRFYPG